MNLTNEIFTETLLSWYEKHGRKHLPWQKTRSPYRVWISEIMLQQTQVKTVIPYFTRFMTSFPDTQTLALAKEDEVFAHWSGLGYYSRARNMHKTAQIIHNQFKNEFPADLDQLKNLPGIGPSTAAAIASLAFNQPTAILDGNVKRVLSRYFLIDGYPEKAAIKKKLWQIANACMPEKNCAEYTQAIMDMGATCCTVKNPNCKECPLNNSCLAYLNNVVVNYPHKKPKQTLSTHHQQFLLLHDKEQQIYLEKRPPTGIWGGLWCLPMLEIQDCPLTYIKNRYQAKSNFYKPLLRLKHTFSHFHLHLNAVSILIHMDQSTLAEHNGRWFNLNELNTIGLAKPIKTIIEYFYSTY